MVLGQHEALELGSVAAKRASGRRGEARLRLDAAGDAVRQRRHHRLARGQLPALAAIEGRPCLDDEILDDELLVAFEAGAGRHVRGLDDRRLGDAELGALGAAPALAAAGLGGRLGGGLHAARLAGLDVGTSLEALQPRDLIAQLGVLGLEPGELLQGLHEQQLQLFEAKPVDVG